MKISRATICVIGAVVAAAADEQRSLSMMAVLLAFAGVLVYLDSKKYR